jgi:proliferating cell nuclear antigen PCNA
MGISSEPIYSENSIVEFRTNQIKPIKSIFDAIKNNLPDTTIFFTPNCMKILQLDGTSNFLVNVCLYGDKFEHFYCEPDPATAGDTGDDTVTINLSAIQLNNIFKNVKTDDNMLEFVYERSAENVKLIFSSEKKAEVRTYTISTQNAEDDSYGEIEGIDEFPYCLSLPCSDLQGICRDFKNSQCDKITISHDGQKLIFSGKGPQIDTSIERNGQSTDKVPRDADQSTYSDVFKFQTLNEFSKCQAGGESKIVKIHLSQGDPIVLHFEVGTLGEMDVAIAAIIPIDPDDMM